MSGHGKHVPASLLVPASLVPALLALALLGGCAASGGPGAGGPGAERPGLAGARGAQQCKAGDTVVASESDCLQDDASCYALASGGFCTGERGSTCPSGSSPVPAGADCAPGARCFAISESLTCAITVN